MTESTSWTDFLSRALSTYANLIFLILWIGFLVALAVNHQWLTELWDWVGALPLTQRVVVWVLFLPIMVGLAVWESSWSVPGRLLGLAFIVGWNLLATSSLIKAYR